MTNIFYPEISRNVSFYCTKINNKIPTPNFKVLFML